MLRQCQPRQAARANTARRRPQRPLRAAFSSDSPTATTADSAIRTALPRPCRTLERRASSGASFALHRRDDARLVLCGIAVRLKPLHRSLQGAIDRAADSIPSSRSALALVTNIFLRPMRTESSVTRGSRLQHLAGDQSVHHAGRVRHRIRQLDLRRRQSRNRRQLVENLLQRQVLAAENVALARNAPSPSPADALARNRTTSTRFNPVST